MEASKRNSNRTKDRNELAFKELTNKLNSIKNFGFFYQYCNNPKCKEVTLFILASHKKISASESKAFSKALEEANVPGLILEYSKYGSVKATCLGLGVNKVLENRTWDQVLSLMHSQQLKHEKSKNNIMSAKCSDYNHNFMAKGTWNNNEVDTRFSNEIRSIPGVRHIDTDGLIYCPKCFKTLYVVEASSDGCPGTPMSNKFKATTMTRKIAELLKATPLLVQHHYNDVEHKNPVYLTSWSTGKAKRFKRTWDSLVKDFDNSFAAHKQHDCH